MQIQKTKGNELEIKTKKASILFDGCVKINDVELEGAGEYEVGGVAVQGLDDNAYIFQAEDITIGFINFKGKISKEDTEKLSNADALVVRLDGDVRQAVEQVGQIEPNIAIYIGSAESKGQLKTNGVSFKEEDLIKLTKAEAEAEQTAYFVEIVNAQS